MPRPRKVSDEAVLAAIDRLHAEFGFAPTVRELCAELGLASPAHVHRYLEKLREEGRVSWVPGKQRTLVVLAAA